MTTNQTNWITFMRIKKLEKHFFVKFHGANSQIFELKLG